jgi:hypothetical protein
MVSLVRSCGSAARREGRGVLFPPSRMQAFVSHRGCTPTKTARETSTANGSPHRDHGFALLTASDYRGGASEGVGPMGMLHRAPACLAAAGSRNPRRSVATPVRDHSSHGEGTIGLGSLGTAGLGNLPRPGPTSGEARADSPDSRIPEKEPPLQDLSHRSMGAVVAAGTAGPGVLQPP